MITVRPSNQYRYRYYDDAPILIEPAHCVAFAIEGRFLISVEGQTRSEGRVVVWDLDARKYLNLTGRNPIWSLGCDPEGRMMAFGTDDRLLITWGLRAKCFESWWNAEERVTTKSFSHILKANLPRPARTRAVAFSPNSGTLGAATGRNLDLWDPSNGQLRTTLSGHDDEITGLAFAPDGRTLASTSFDRTARLWDAADGRPISCHDWELGRMHCVAFAPDGMTIAAGGDSGLVVWDLDELC